MILILPLTSAFHFQIDGFPPSSEQNRGHSCFSKKPDCNIPQRADTAQPPRSATWANSGWDFTAGAIICHHAAPEQARRFPSETVSLLAELSLRQRDSLASLTAFWRNWEILPKDKGFGDKAYSNKSGCQSSVLSVQYPVKHQQNNDGRWLEFPTSQPQNCDFDKCA